MLERFLEQYPAIQPALISVWESHREQMVRKKSLHNSFFAMSAMTVKMTVNFLPILLCYVTLKMYSFSNWLAWSWLRKISERGKTSYIWWEFCTLLHTVSSEKSPTCGQILPILQKLGKHFTVIEDDTVFVSSIKQAVKTKRYLVNTFFSNKEKINNMLDIFLVFNKYLSYRGMTSEAFLRRPLHWTHTLNTTLRTAALSGSR